MQRQKQNKIDLHRPRIGVDLLGADTPGDEFLRAIVDHNWDEQHPPLFTLIATQEIFDTVDIPEGFQRKIVTEEVLMEDNPLTAVRHKKDSSIAQGIEMLKSYDIDAFVSAGNTGAILAHATLKLPLLPGIERPALITLIPSKLEPIAVLDVGAGVKATAENLLEFAYMGIAYQKTRGIENPTVGLLNIGEEKQKGTPEVQKAYKILQTLNENTPIDAPIFTGNIEGRDVFRGDIDVLVTDGFTGNVFLKTSEGIAGFILDQMENLGPLEKLPGIKSLLETFRSRLHYAEYPGALLCGVDGIVMKCHGESSPDALINSIKGSSRLVQHFFLEKLKAEL